MHFSERKWVRGIRCNGGIPARRVALIFRISAYEHPLNNGFSCAPLWDSVRALVRAGLRVRCRAHTLPFLYDKVSGVLRFTVLTLPGVKVLECYGFRAYFRMGILYI